MFNNIAFNLINIKNQDMLKNIHMKACKHKWELEIAIKTNEPISRPPNYGGPSTNHPLKVMHP